MVKPTGIAGTNATPHKCQRDNLAGTLPVPSPLSLRVSPSPSLLVCIPLRRLAIEQRFYERRHVCRSTDNDWNIDVKKSVARPPAPVRKHLRRIADITRKRATARIAASVSADVLSCHHPK